MEGVGDISTEDLLCDWNGDYCRSQIEHSQSLYTRISRFFEKGLQQVKGKNCGGHVTSRDMAI